MPKGPQGQERPADAVANAATVARIGMGEDKESVIMIPRKEIQSRKDEGALARSFEPVQRKAIAGRAANSRWKTEREMTMTKKTERQTLFDRFQGMKKDGLTDMKFQLGKVGETTADAVYAEVNRLLDNVEEGKVQEMTSWDDSRSKVSA